MGRTIDDVADQLKNNKANRASCVLLIGAGCSVEAGIPLATGFVRRIKDKFPRKYDLAPEKTYPACMRELAPSERHELISTAIDEAKINLAHIAIARMMKSGHIDRVLTTNFDPLVMRACALFNIFPAIYDMTTAGERFRPSWVRDRAVFHLHGQRDGFFQAHTSRDVEALEQSLDPLFRDCADRRTWLVVGYSGANDPVFRQLERMPDFGHDLYWVPFKGEPMPPHLEPLMQPGRGGYWLDGDWDADNFLVQLAGRIECPDAPFLTHPFIHLREGLEQIGSWTLPGESSRLPIVDTAFRKIERAIGCIEERSRACPLDETTSEPAEDLEGLTRSWLMDGRYDAIIEREADIRTAQAPAALDSLAWAYLMTGNNTLHQARATNGPESEDLSRQAVDQYRCAIELKPDFPAAFNNLGNAFSDLGERTAGAEAKDLFHKALEQYKRAIEIKPDYPAASNNMGLALSRLGKRMTGPEAEDLFHQAIEHYKRAIEIKPDYPDPFNNMGSALLRLGQRMTGPEAEDLFHQSIKHYKRAIELKPDDHDTLNNMGTALSELGQRMTDPEAEDLFRRAIEQFQKAIDIKPDFPAAFHNLGIALSRLGQRKTGQEADDLFRQAIEPCQRAVSLRPDDPEMINNLGISLFLLGQRIAGPEAEDLFRQAEEEFTRANQIQSGRASYNLACIAALRGGEDECRRWLEDGQTHGTLPDRAHLETDPDLHSVRETDWFKALLDSLPGD